MDIAMDKSTTVVTMGTSLTSGNSWVASLEQSLRATSSNPNQVHVVNVAVGGASSVNGLNTQMPAALAQKPDAVLIEFGINDAYLPYSITQEQSVAHLNNIIDQFKQQNPDVVIILQTMNNPVNNPAGDHLSQRPQIEAYYQNYRNLARARDLILIDHYPMWLNLYNTNPMLWNSYVPDGIHPNQAGNDAIVVPGIFKALQSVTMCDRATFLRCGTSAQVIP
jgi:acyl-CoA thioesterase I